MHARTSAIARVCGVSLVGTALAAGLGTSLAGAASAAVTAPAARAASPAADGTGASLQACVAYTYAAIERHTVVAASPPACAGLSRAQINLAASTAIHMTLTSGTKAARRHQAVAAAWWARALITSPPPAPRRPVVSQPSVSPPDGAAAGALGLGAVGETAAKAGALLAWLATAASGGWVLARWLLAGGSLRRSSATAAPPAVTLGHAGGGALGLLLWAAFLLTGRVAAAWIALGLLAPVAGLGMAVLAVGLPRPVRAPLGTRRHGRGRPVIVTAAHGLFAVISLLLVLMATIGAG